MDLASYPRLNPSVTCQGRFSGDRWRRQALLAFAFLVCGESSWIAGCGWRRWISITKVSLILSIGTSVQGRSSTKVSFDDVRSNQIHRGPAVQCDKPVPGCH